MICIPIPKVGTVMCVWGGVLSLKCWLEFGLSWGYSCGLGGNIRKDREAVKQNMSSLPLGLTTNQLGEANRTTLKPRRQATWGLFCSPQRHPTSPVLLLTPTTFHHGALDGSLFLSLNFFYPSQNLGLHPNPSASVSPPTSQG